MKCPKCGRQTCDCLLNDRHYLLGRVEELDRQLAKEDGHTNGKTKGIVPCPQWVVDWAATQVGGAFDLDVAALPENAKAPRFFTAKEDGLKQRWTAKRIWVNPPYHREFLIKWVRKAYQAAQRGARVCCLLPLWPGSDWFTDYLLRGQFAFLYGGHGLPTGRWSTDYCALIFNGVESWRMGLLSYKGFVCK